MDEPVVEEARCRSEVGLVHGCGRPTGAGWADGAGGGSVITVRVVKASVSVSGLLERRGLHRCHLAVAHLAAALESLSCRDALLCDAVCRDCGWRFRGWHRAR